MAHFFKSLVLVICLLFSALHMACAAEGGKIILDLQEDYDADDIYDYPKLYQEYLRELDIFDQRYAGDQINENFSDDVAELHPEYTESQVKMKTAALRYGIKGRRAYSVLKQELQKILLENDIPLSFDDDEYEMGGSEEYQPTDKPLIIKKFKKIVAYSDSERDQAAVAEKAARDAGLETPYERRQVLKKALLSGDWKTLITHGLFEGKDFVDDHGIGEWVKTPELQARLVSGQKGVHGEAVSGALQLYPIPGWFLLLRDYGGHAGLKIDFAGAKNLRDIKLSMPLPRRIYLPNHDSVVGYPEQVIAPFAAEVETAGQALLLKADIKAVLCQDTDNCREVSLQPRLELQSAETTEPSRVAVGLKYLKNLAPQPTNKKLRLERLAVEDGTPQVLRLEAEASKTPAAFTAYIEGDGAEKFAPPYVVIEGKKITARFAALDKQADFAGQDLSIVASIAPEISIRQTIKAERPIISDRAGSRIGILLRAFCGGLLLNLLPCGFPILALWIMNLTKFGARNIAKIRKESLGLLGGMLVATVALVGALAALKISGRQLYWGMQFEHAWFLILVLFALALFIAQRWGLLNLSMPEFAQAQNRPKFGSFAVCVGGGVLLVVLAAAGTAPYLSEALNEAFAGTWVQISEVMLCALAGAGLPYACFAILPQSAYFVPRPGKWLYWGNILIVLALFACVLRAGFLLAACCGAGIIGLLCLLLAVVWLVLYIRRLALENLEEQESDAQIYGIVRKIIDGAAVLVLAAMLVWCGHSSMRRAEAKIQSLSAANYTQIEEGLRQGRRVLLKVGADWCLSCRYNEIFAFSSPQVQNILTQKDFVVLEQNQRLSNPEISSLMQKYNRYAPPFYIVFAPDIPQGIVLPESLNGQNLQDILENFSR